MKPFIRTIGIAGATVKIGMGNPGCNFSRDIKSTLGPIDADQKSCLTRKNNLSSCKDEELTAHPLGRGYRQF